MFVALIVVHVIIAVSLILVVLMQSSKGEGLAGSAFGGGLSGAVFGGRGAATFLTKLTRYLAIAFMVMCIVLAYMSAQNRAAVTGIPTDAESAVTRQAQQEMERQMQRQQQQQGLPTEGGTQTTPAPAGGEQTTPPAEGGGQ